MKLRPKAKALPLELGSWLHTLLQTHYDGESWRDAHKKLVRDYNNLWEEEREILGDLPRIARTIMRGYLRRYEREDEARYHVVDSEMDEIVVLPNGIRLEVVVDLVVEDQEEGGLWVWDHKFRTNLGDADDMLLDPQLTLYYWALEHMGYRPLRGAVYNEVRTKPPAVPDRLKSGRLSERKNIDTDVYTYTRAIKDNDLDPRDYTEMLQLIATREHDRFFRRTAIPKDPPVVRTVMQEMTETANEIQTAERRNRYPRTFDFTCKFQCEYKDLCIAELHGADIDSIIKQNFEVSHRGSKN